MVMSGWSVNLIILFPGGLKPPKRFQYPTTALLESAEGETKVCGMTVFERDIKSSGQDIKPSGQAIKRRHKLIILCEQEILLSKRDTKMFGRDILS